MRTTIFIITFGNLANFKPRVKPISSAGGAHVFIGFNISNRPVWIQNGLFRAKFRRDSSNRLKGFAYFRFFALNQPQSYNPESFNTPSYTSTISWPGAPLKTKTSPTRRGTKSSPTSALISSSNSAPDGLVAFFAKFDPTTERTIEGLFLNRIISFCNKNADPYDEDTDRNRAILFFIFLQKIERDNSRSILKLIETAFANWPASTMAPSM